MEIGRISGALTSPVNYTLLTTAGSAAPKVSEEPVPIPEGMPIRNRVSSEFGIELLDTDVRFISAELLVIEDVLQDYRRRKRKHHLIGVKQIVKNRETRVALMKTLIHAGGAYDGDNRRIYLFDDLGVEKIPEVLVHEIGHAFNHFNLDLNKFLDFIASSGYGMVEFRKCFNAGNSYYQISTVRVELPKDKWDGVVERFSMKSIAKNSDVFGEIVFDLPHKTRQPWDQNPLEKFAWAYEWFIDRNEDFKHMAETRAGEGDESWLNDYEFLAKEVFREMG